MEATRSKEFTEVAAEAPEDGFYWLYISRRDSQSKSWITPQWVIGGVSRYTLIEQQETWIDFIGTDSSAYFDDDLDVKVLKVGPRLIAPPDIQFDECGAGEDTQ